MHVLNTILIIGLFALMLLILWKATGCRACDKREQEEDTTTCVKGIGWPR